jgi:hypothetical protein
MTPRIAVALLVASLAASVTGCSPAAPRAGAASASAPAPSSSSVGTPTAGSVSPSASTSPASAVSLPADGPPVASLAAEGGDPVPGELGSYTLGDRGSDSPWLPGALIAVGRREPLVVALSDGVAIGAWTARTVPAEAAPGGAVRPLATGSTLIRFAAPEAGAWSVAVTIQFADRPGSATWYWKLVAS